MRQRWTSRLSPCPRSLLTGSRNAVRVLVRAGRTSWWKCLRSYRTLPCSSGLSSRSLTFQFLRVGLDGAVLEVFKVSSQDRVQRLRPLLRTCVLVLWMRLLLGFFHFSPNQKKCGVGSALGVGTGCGLYSMDSGGLCRVHGGRLRRGCGVGGGGGGGGGCSDSLRRWVSACAGLHEVPRAPVGTASAGVCLPSHTHGLSFTRKLQPMSENSPRTFQTEAVVAASGPGGGGRGVGGQGSEAARCSCAEDRDDGRGRPCALQRQLPAVLRVRSGRASASVRLQRAGLSCCDAETGLHSAHSTVRCSSWCCCYACSRLAVIRRRGGEGVAAGGLVCF